MSTLGPSIPETRPSLITLGNGHLASQETIDVPVAFRGSTTGSLNLRCLFIFQDASLDSSAAPLAMTWLFTMNVLPSLEFRPIVYPGEALELSSCNAGIGGEVRIDDIAGLGPLWSIIESPTPLR